MTWKSASYAKSTYANNYACAQTDAQLKCTKEDLIRKSRIKKPGLLAYQLS